MGEEGWRTVIKLILYWVCSGDKYHGGGVEVRYKVFE